MTTPGTDPFQLATRNTVEVVTEEDLRRTLGMERPRCYAGYEPSGEIHLGHLVTVNKLMDLQAAGFHVVVLLADLHAFLNRKGTLEEVEELSRYNRACFEALGLAGVEYVTGSALQLCPEYEILVLRLAQQITLNRAQRSMDEVGRQMEHPTVSQMIYPIMQMVDIAQLKADVAVGGIDQRKIHMLAREYLPRARRREDVLLEGELHLGGRKGGGHPAEALEGLLPPYDRGEPGPPDPRAPRLPPHAVGHGEEAREVRRGPDL